MLEWLSEIDKALFLLFNGLGHPYLDTFMIWLSDKYIWFPLYAYLIFRLYRNYHLPFYQPLLALILVIIISDQTTSGFMKPFFERLRPCHNEELADMIILVKDCGGSYGFASSHAANTFGLATFFFLIERSRFSIFMLIWAFWVSYSRIYLGVHYPLDVIAGGAVGMVAAFVCQKSLYQINPRLKEY